jgi:uncharacterized membrane protein (DUF2068 family)
MLTRKGDDWVRMIGVFKLCKGLVFLIVGLGFATFVHKDMADQVIWWMRLFSLRQEDHYIDMLLSWATGFNQHDFGVLKISIFVYAALMLTEGVGLMLLERWAEYLTVFATASFVPLEVWSDIRRFGWIKTFILLLNLLALWYLSTRLFASRQKLQLTES